MLKKLLNRLFESLKASKTRFYRLIYTTTALRPPKCTTITPPAKSGRKKVYSSAAERQKAYRDRKKQKDLIEIRAYVEREKAKQLKESLKVNA